MTSESVKTSSSPTSLHSIAVERSKAVRAAALDPREGDGLSEYSTYAYYSTAEHHLVCAAHQELVRRHRGQLADTVRWYWNRATGCEAMTACRTEVVGPYSLHSGSFWDLPLPLVCIYLDSQLKTYMDRDALGDEVKHRSRSGGTNDREIRASREAELARRIGGGSLQAGDLLIAMIEYRGYVLGGMIVNPGTRDESVGSLMARDGGASSIAALQAKFTLPEDDPFLVMKESAIADLVRYFRIPDHALREILSPDLLNRAIHRKAVHLIRALTICEAFAVTQRWMARRATRISTGVCETPNGDVKALIEGRQIKMAHGGTIRVNAIPHRVLTSSTGAQLYPAAYQNRPEAMSKIYTLYAFDFGDVAERAQKYRAKAISAFESLQ